MVATRCAPPAGPARPFIQLNLNLLRTFFSLFFSISTPLPNLRSSLYSSGPFSVQNSNGSDTCSYFQHNVSWAINLQRNIGVQRLNNYDYNYDAHKTRLVLPTRGRVAKHRVYWKEHYQLLFEDTSLSNSRWTLRDLVAVLRDQAFAWERPGHWSAKSHQRGKIPKTLFTETR